MTDKRTNGTKAGRKELSGDELSSVAGGGPSPTTPRRAAISPEAAVEDRVPIAFEQGDIHHPS